MSVSAYSTTSTRSRRAMSIGLTLWSSATQGTFETTTCNSCIASYYYASRHSCVLRRSETTSRSKSYIRSTRCIHAIPLRHKARRMRIIAAIMTTTFSTRMTRTLSPPTPHRVCLCLSPPSTTLCLQKQRRHLLRSLRHIFFYIHGVEDARRQVQVSRGAVRGVPPRRTSPGSRHVVSRLRFQRHK